MFDQKSTPLIDALNEYVNSGRISFHIPAHKDGNSVSKEIVNLVGNKVFKIDSTESYGLDDLHQPEGAIKIAQELAAEAFGAFETFFLVNGTTSGIIAALTAVAGNGEKILIPRNAHKAVYMSLIISGATPVYIQPEYNEAYGLTGGLSPQKVEEAFAENLDAKGIFVINPTYYGVCSDIAKIVEIAHKNSAVVIADEAHGCHMCFQKDLPISALAAGADIAVQSTHKMIGSFTQSSMLHVKSNLIDMAKLRMNLQMMQSTSPSYILMASLDGARNHAVSNGNKVFGNLLNYSKSACDKINKIEGITCLEIANVLGRSSIFDFEPMRFTITARDLGIEGYELDTILTKEYGIEPEFAEYFYVICVMGMGTQNADIDSLVTALTDISKNYKGKRIPLAKAELPPLIPPQKMMPRDAYFAKKKRIPWKDAKNEVSAEMIIPYPPGIPTICPGELITKDVWHFLEKQRQEKRHLHGPMNGILDTIEVVL